ncbi:pollen receptor-like kinase 3 [Trifolium pratense]|uniref:pollen receptor-like kinase 3 n=1 Tax=Trifolium pratense TaxID=57577 RepID=UPI001E695C5D|nr:pollen receptor-like kinase 3 [Trifolium pratense]
MAAASVLLLISLSFLFLISSAAQPQSETQSLLKLKQSFTNSDKILSSWIPNVSPCSGTWVGVICFSNIITGLHLTDLSLSGTIDVDAIAEIRGLRTLNFINNSFSGPIPQFNKLGTIKSLLLQQNQFTGPIPQDFFTKLSSLKKVWLSGNKFSGNIPVSLTELDLLKELHLEGNQFSGQLPDLKQDFKSFDVSNNQLEGPIPESLAKFSAVSFAGNAGLCGKPLEKQCDGSSSSSSSSTTSSSYLDSVTYAPTENGASGLASKVMVLMLLAVLAAVILLFLKSRQRRRDDDFSVVSRDSSVDEVQVRVPISRASSASERVGRRNVGESTKRSGMGAGNRNGIGDLVMVNDEKGTFGLQDLMKAAAEVLGNGGLGSAYKAAMSSGLSVVVKRMREMNKIGKDVFDAEMRQFGRIRHPNILTPLAYHYRREEKLFVTEYMPKGSLLYVLHGDRGTSHADLTWPIRLKIAKGIARGLSFLYSEFSTYDLPHGNLKSSNVLLTNEYEPLLGDFAFQPLINPSTAVQSMFAYKTPDYIQNQKLSQKADVYCLGIIILEIITGKFPSQYHSNGKGGTDVVQWVLTAISERREAELIDPELKDNASNSINNMLQLLLIGAACTESNPEQRVHMKEAIRRIEEVQL